MKMEEPRLWIINNSPISAGDNPKVAPKAGMMRYMPMGARSLAKWPMANWISRLGLLSGRAAKGGVAFSMTVILKKKASRQAN